MNSKLDIKRTGGLETLPEDVRYNADWKIMK